MLKSKKCSLHTKKIRSSGHRSSGSSGLRVTCANNGFIATNSSFVRAMQTPAMVFQQFKMLLLSIVAVFRRALCCFSRRRKPSFSEPLDGLQCVNVVDNNNFGNRRDQQKHPERDWNSWDDSPRTVEEHIEQYRQRIAKPPTPQKEEQEPDFFSELAPVIQPQPKYYLDGDTQEKTDFSRLKATTDIPIAINADLEDWADEDPGGWEELDSDKTKQMIREKRREMRNQRQKSTKLNGIEHNNSPNHELGINATRLHVATGNQT